MKHIVRNILIALIALMVIAFALYPKLKPGDGKPAGAAAAGGPMMLAVEAVHIKPQRLENIIRSTGAIMANEQVELRSEIPGRVERIHFREGQAVKKGDLLFEIDDQEISAQVERLRFVQKLNEDIEFRQRQLLEREAISREEYEIALTTLNTTISDLKEREARLFKHRFYAPFDGFIGLRLISEGSYITPSDLFGTLYNINPIKVEFSIPERYGSAINRGDSILFNVEATPEVFSGIVYAYEPRIDPRTRTLAIRATSRNDSGVLLPGQFARVSYVLDVIERALLVPSEAVVPEMNGHKVFLYRSGRVSEQVVEIGMRTESDVQITSGLQAGDTVITTGILQVRTGMPVSLSQVI